MLSIIPAIALGVGLLSRKSQNHIDTHNEKLSQAIKVVNNIIDNIITVKCFNTQEREWQHYRMAVDEAAASFLKQAVYNAAQTGFVRFAGITMFVQGKSQILFDMRFVSYGSEQDSGLGEPKFIQVPHLLVRWSQHSGLA